MGTCTPDEDFPCDSDGKESTCSAGDLGLIPGFGRVPAEGNGIPLQYSCLEHPMDRGSWLATVHGITESDTIEKTEHTCMLGQVFFLTRPQSGTWAQS